LGRGTCKGVREMLVLLVEGEVFKPGDGRIAERVENGERWFLRVSAYSTLVFNSLFSELICSIVSFGALVSLNLTELNLYDLR
jgi:hypothetical protein